MRVSLLVAQRLHGIESGGASRGIETGYKTHNESENNGEDDQPPGNGPEMFGRKRLTLEVNVGPHVDDLSDGPAQRDAHNAAQDPHGAGFGEEKFFHIAVAGADGFHDADLTSSFENGHHQRVHDPDGSDDQRQTAENSEE